MPSSTPPTAGTTTLEGFDAAVLTAGPLEATFLPELNMICSSLRHRGDELLESGRGPRVYRETGAVFGIPLLHPWANRLGADAYEVHGRRVGLPPGPPVQREENGLPIHGIVSEGWAVAALDAGDDGARVAGVLDFAHEVFPFPHRLEVEARLTPADLTITTTVTPTAAVPVPVAFGFHPYLRLPRGERGGWRVRLPARRHLVLDERSLPTGEGSPEEAETFLLAQRHFDDAYDGIEQGARFELEGDGLVLSVRFEEGFPEAQVFSPPAGRFVCFEPMTAPVDALRTGAGLRSVAPGDSFAARFSVAVSEAPPAAGP